jgi:hypothetical protein
MKTLSMFAVTGMLALAAVPAAAQTKTLTGETKTVTASVEAIDKATRAVTVKKPDGTYDVFYFPETIRRFDTLKVGDKITAKYYENLVLRVKAPGEKAVDSASGGIVRSEDRPAGTASRQRTITATIAAIDQAGRRSRSPVRTAGSTAAASRTRRRWRRSKWATGSTSPGPKP